MAPSSQLKRWLVYMPNLRLAHIHTVFLPFSEAEPVMRAGKNATQMQLIFSCLMWDVLPEAKKINHCHGKWLNYAIGLKTKVFYNDPFSHALSFFHNRQDRSLIEYYNICSAIKIYYNGWLNMQTDICIHMCSCSTMYCFGLAQYILYVDHKYLGNRNRYVFAVAGHFNT